VINPWQEYDIRSNASTGQWLDIQKAAAASEGKSNPIFKGALGMYNNTVIHSHKAGIRFNDYGAGAVKAARALFLGEQAAVCAFGSGGSGMRFDWNEEMQDQPSGYHYFFYLRYEENPLQQCGLRRDLVRYRCERSNCVSTLAPE